MGLTGTEALRLIVDHAEDQEQATLGLVLQNGEWSAAYTFGREAPDSPMAGGAAYGMGETVGDALRGILEDVGL
jgi:hypothetical protein